MNKLVQKIVRVIILIISAAVLFCLVSWYVIPVVQMTFEMLFLGYNHKVAVLPKDIECQCISTDGASKTIILPKGLMIYSHCSHDYSRMSLDNKETYKVYLKLDAQTIKDLIKDSDESQRNELRKNKRYGELEILDATRSNDKTGKGESLMDVIQNSSNQ